jgi:hypothetical protein
MSSGVTIVPFDPHHCQVMDVRDVEFQDTFQLKDVYLRLQGVKESIDRGEGEAGTFIHNGRILCCAGFRKLWPGVLEGWIIPSIWVKEAPVSFAKYMRRYLEAVASTFKAHRVQTLSPDDQFHERWMKFMGFEKEGVLKNYTHRKHNYGIYARLF